MTPPKPMVPIPGRPGWRRDPITGGEFYMSDWLNDGLDDVEAVRPLRLVSDDRELPPVAPDAYTSHNGYPTPAQQESWQRQIATSSVKATIRNLEKLIELRPPDLDGVRAARLAAKGILAHLEMHQAPVTLHGRGPSSSEPASA